MRVAIYGGSFNPPHVGHLLAAAYARAVYPIDEVWLVPCPMHAFEKALAPFAHRLALCEILAATLGPWCRASAIERDVADATPAHTSSRTIDTVRALIARHPTDTFSLIVGSDIVAEIDSWKSSADLRALCLIHVVPRRGSAAPDSPALPDVSSTTIRARLSAGASIDDLVPRGVGDYIRTHKLYVAANSRGSG